MEQGKAVLWENIKSFEEELLLNSDNEHISKNIALFKGELKARLLFERFLNNIKDDGAETHEAIMAINEAIKELEDGTRE